MYYYDQPDTVPVRMKELDGIFDKDFDLIFMDIEGSEHYALMGMQSVLSRAKALVVEFIPHHLVNVSGVTVDESLLNIYPHKDVFSNLLKKMFDEDKSDDGIVFEKTDEKVS